MRRSLSIALAAWCLYRACPVLAQEVAVPGDLKQWQSWVLYGEEFRRCPMRHAVVPNDTSSFICSWPGRTRLDVSSTGGEFAQSWRTYAESWVPLPGDDRYWPEEVRANGTAVAVVAQDGTPRVRLGPGDHTLSGRFAWTRRPESLRLPAATALVDLSIDGNPIAPIELREGRLWLGAVRTVTVPRSLQMQVYRLLQDDVPLRLITQIQLKVSGDAREELLASALPEGFVPMAIAGALPARFEPDGKLRVQVRSGEHVLTIGARATSPDDTIEAPDAEGIWADQEIWSYRSNDRLRITAIEAAPAIDPAQAGVPDDWRALPAFRLERGAAIEIAERSRGLSSADANRLSLQRDLWLTFDREALVASDRISGSMQQGWRLDMLQPYRLLNARREEEMLLVTDGAEGRTGVELRTPAVSLTTMSRVEQRGAQPVTGWDARFEDVRTTLHLPPGHRLLVAWGADDFDDSWVSEWRLLDLFLLMLATVAAFRLLGPVGGALAAAAVVLTHHESMAPGWLWINLFIAVAVARVTPEGRLRPWARRYQFLSAAALALLLIPFAIAQYRLAIHPQLANGYVAAGYPMAGLSAEEAVFAASDASAPVESRMIDSVSEHASKRQAAKRFERYAPDAMLQTGPGIPDWQYLLYHINWSGPVDADQTVRLTILSPFWLSLWRVLGIVASAALLMALLRLAYGVPRNFRLPPWRPAAAVGALCTLMAFGAPPNAEAQTPDNALLSELKRRLIEPPKCAPGCTQVVAATVSVAGDRLEVQMQVHAQANVALGVPQAGPQWIIERVSIDDRPANMLAREAGQLQLPLTPGVHRVSIAGRVAQAFELSLEFPQPPRRVAVRADGWDASGLSEGRLLNSSLQLARRAGTQAQSTVAPQRFAPFVRIHRRIFMNLDWTVSTVVERLAPEDGAFTLRLPTLPGEAVLTPGLDVREGSVLVSMPSGVRFTGWESSLSRMDRMEWSAAGDQPWVEQWDVVVSPMWHAEFSGTPAILPQVEGEGVWINQFLPRPGESLQVSIVRPAASAGSTLAVDSVNVTTSFGQRLSETTLRFSYRSSQGGRHNIRLPADARVDSVKVDDEMLPVRPTDGLLPLTLAPGRHVVFVTFSRDEGAHLLTRPPAIDLGVEGANVRADLELARNRWVLFAWGRGVGPAILYWGELVVFAIIALALGRLRRTPLATRDWLLLGLGLSTFSWWVLLVFGVWLFVLDRRSEWRIQTSWRFNAVQIVLGILSVAVLITLVSAIPYGLLGQPDMGIRSDVGPRLSWFVDSTPAQLPQPGAISVSIWFYKLAMLLWALWLSFALLQWLPWAWRQYASEGLWRGKVLSG